MWGLYFSLKEKTSIVGVCVNFWVRMPPWHLKFRAIVNLRIDVCEPYETRVLVFRSRNYGMLWAILLYKLICVAIRVKDIQMVILDWVRTECNSKDGFDSFWWVDSRNQENLGKAQLISLVEYNPEFLSLNPWEGGWMVYYWIYGQGWWN